MVAEAGSKPIRCRGFHRGLCPLLAGPSDPVTPPEVVVRK